MTTLNKKRIPATLAASMMRAPMNRTDVLTENEIQEINNKSKLVKKYSELIDRESAYKMLKKNRSI